MTSLIAARRGRVLAAMAEREIDVLALGRQDDANYASGMHRLWTAGTRPFGAGCLVVRSTGRTHVLSGWDAGLPETMTWDDLYPSTWNPRVMSGYLAAIPGLAEAKRIGVDEVSPSFARAAARLAPHAEVVPADDLMSAVRRIKLPEEIAKIRAACVVAWTGFEAAVLASGVSPDEQIRAAVKALAAVGATIPSSTPAVKTVDGTTVIDIGVIVDGYEGGVGHRAPVAGLDAPPDRPTLPHACRPGARHTDLARAATQDDWLVRGLGMGFEQPVIDPTHGFDEVLVAGMVLSVGDGGERSVVHVTPTGPEILSDQPRQNI